MRANVASASQEESTGLRLTFLTLLVVSLFVLLLGRLWFLQVMAAERYADLAQGNAVRTLPLEAPRGKLLDRDGEPLVTNRYAPVVSVQLSEMGDRKDEVLADLADLLGTTVEQIERRVAGSRVSAVRPKPIAIDVPEDIVFYIHENRATRYPGVYAETLPLRSYPHGPLAAHVVGYLGEINSEQLDSEEYAGYSLGDLIGWSGVERTYERELRGTKGEQRLAVDARGRVLGDIDETLPVPGADLVLTLDADAQRITEEALTLGIEKARETRDAESGRGRGGTFKAPAGAAVVLDPRNGEVLAMASHPTFQPTDFVGGVSHETWTWLQDPQNHFPLINRAVQSSYPPGSVFKVVSAAAALDQGYLERGEQLPCPGEWYWNTSRYRNWKRSNSGPMDLAEALEDSCDTVFYELARRMWLDEQREAEEGGGEVRERLSVEAQAWGFGARTGIDLPGERAGVVPGREWKRAYWERFRGSYCTQAATAPPGSYEQELFSDLCTDGGRWRGGDAVNMSIGQGEVQTTPLQVANAFAAIANGGTLYKPHVAKAVVRPDGTVEEVAPEVLATLPVSHDDLAYIHEGLVRVASRGTAAGVFGGFDVPVAAKTGTAEYKPKQPIAWFAAYAPADAPRYVVAVMVEEGGGGSQTAAPIAKRIFEGLLGLEQEAIAAGVPTD